MLGQINDHLLANGCYRTNLMSETQRAICSDVPAGTQIRNGQREEAIVPPGIIIIRDFLNAETCKQITDFADNKGGQILQVMFRDPLTGEVKTQPDQGRKTEYVNIKGLERDLSGLLETACRSILTPHYQIDIEWYEKPTMLRYGPGGKYEHHSDSENWDAVARTWNRFCDRAYSLLIYLNEDFTGGSLYYQNFDFRLAPTTGTLVAFPSDHRYVHRAEPVASGTRYAIVSWVVVKGRRSFTRGQPYPPHAVPLA